MQKEILKRLSDTERIEYYIRKNDAFNLYLFLLIIGTLVGVLYVIAFIFKYISQGVKDYYLPLMGSAAGIATILFGLLFFWYSNDKLEKEFTRKVFKKRR